MIAEVLLASVDTRGDVPYRMRAFVRRALERDVIGAWPGLEIAAARHVLPIWASAHPASVPVDLLDLAARCLAGDVTSAALDAAAKSFRAALEDALDQASTSGRFAPVAAGLAAWAAASSVLGRIPLHDADTELEIDPDEFDASFHASVAWAGGAVWERGVGDDARRREYWSWFIAEVESRMAMIQPLGGED